MSPPTTPGRGIGSSELTKTLKVRLVNGVTKSYDRNDRAWGTNFLVDKSTPLTPLVSASLHEEGRPNTLCLHGPFSITRGVAAIIDDSADGRLPEAAMYFR